MINPFTGKEMNNNTGRKMNNNKGFDIAGRLQSHIAKCEDIIEEQKKDAYKNSDFRGVTDYNELLTLIGEDNAIKVAADINEKVGTTTKSANSFAALYLLGNDEATLKMKSDVLTLVFKEGLRNAKGIQLPSAPGKKEYKGIAIEKLQKDSKNIDMVVMDESKETQIALLLEMFNSLKNLSSIDTILLDLVNYHRVYQEKIIDAAKKLYQVFALFFSVFIRSNSAIGINMDFKSMKNLEKLVEDNAEISLINRSKFRGVGNVGEFNVHRRRGENVKLTFQDDLADLQDNAFIGFETFLIQLVETYKQVAYSTELTELFSKTGEDLATVIALYENVVKPYNGISATISARTARIIGQEENYDLTEEELIELAQEKQTLKQERESAFNDLSTIARYITRDLSMVDAGRAMLQASIIKNTKSPTVDLIQVVGDWYINRYSANRAYENIAPELFMEFMMNEYQRQEAVSRIECSKDVRDELVDGEKLVFTNGLCETKAISLNVEDAGEASEIDRLNAVIRIIDGVVYAAIAMEFDRIVVNDISEVENVFVQVYKMEDFLTGGADEYEAFFENIDNVNTVSKFDNKNNVVTTKHNNKDVIVARYSKSSLFKDLSCSDAKLFANDFNSFLLLKGVSITNDIIEKSFDTVLAEIKENEAIDSAVSAFGGSSKRSTVVESNKEISKESNKEISKESNKDVSKESNKDVSNKLVSGEGAPLNSEIFDMYAYGMEEEYMEDDDFTEEEILF